MSLGPSGCDEHSERSRFSKSVALERNQPTKAAELKRTDRARGLDRVGWTVFHRPRGLGVALFHQHNILSTARWLPPISASRSVTNHRLVPGGLIEQDQDQDQGSVSPRG